MFISIAFQNYSNKWKKLKKDKIFNNASSDPMLFETVRIVNTDLINRIVSLPELTINQSR